MRPKRMVVVSQQCLDGRSEWIGVWPYPSHGKRYWRLQWGKGRRSLGQMHIPGGACGSARADARAMELSRHIRRGRSLGEVQALVQRWRTRKRPR